MSGAQIYINPLGQPDDLFCRYSGQSHPQPAVLALDLEDGELTCRFNSEIGTGLPESVWNRRTLWFDIPILTADAANRLLDEVRPLAQRILDGSSIDWDGHNEVGVFNDDAAQARDELAKRCAPDNGSWDDSDTVGEWTATDWFSTVSREETTARLGLTADTSDEQIAELAEEEARCAREDCGATGYTILTGADDYLIDLRDDLARIREALARYDVVTEHPTLGYDNPAELAVQDDGEWIATITDISEAAPIIAERENLDAATLRLIPADCPTTAPRWIVSQPTAVNA